MNRFFSTASLWPAAGLAVVRMITGFFLIYHGWEIFNDSKMNEYQTWNAFKNSANVELLVYGGKAAELVGGLLLFCGLFTRMACLLIAGTMSYIAFFVGNGKIWYEDQHPFLFVLLAFVFFFMGPGAFSADALIFKKR